MSTKRQLFVIMLTQYYQNPEFLFLENNKEINIINPISLDLNVLRNSIYSNLIIYLSKNLDRGFKDISLFEIGPVFLGLQPGQQETEAGELRQIRCQELREAGEQSLV